MHVPQPTISVVFFGSQIHPVRNDRQLIVELILKLRSGAGSNVGFILKRVVSSLGFHWALDHE